jgi:hypothetical protein
MIFGKDRFHGVMVLLTGFAPPRLDRGDTFDRSPLVVHQSISSEAAI